MTSFFPETMTSTCSEKSQDIMEEKLELSGNNLADAVKWLKNGDIVVLHIGTKGFFYHVTSLKPKKIIYIDVESMPDLTLDGEWPYYFIENAEATRLNSSQLKDYDLKSLKRYNFVL